MENKDRKRTQPEFTPDYIDQLFSGTNSEPQPQAPVTAPPPEAQEPPQPPRQNKPSKLKRKLRRQCHGGGNVRKQFLVSAQFPF